MRDLSRHGLLFAVLIACAVVCMFLAATPAERAAMAREQGWQTRRTPTHRGEPRPWAIAGYHAAMQKLRTPTHRGEPRNG